MSSTPPDIDINHSLDYEIAVEREQAKAGVLFRKLHALKKDPNATAEALDAARAAYGEADNQAQALRRTDHKRIAAILAEIPARRKN